MSFEADNIEHELSIEDILLKILDELKIKNARDLEVTGVEIDRGDIDD